VTTGMPFFRAVAGSMYFRKTIGFLLIATLLSCSGYPLRGDRPRGVYHRVKSGETLSVIARAYHVQLQDLAEINNIRNPNQIETDSVIFVPDANQVLDDVLSAARSVEPSSGKPAEAPPKAKTKTVKESSTTRKESPKEMVTEAENRREKPPADVTAKDRVALSRAADRDAASRRSDGTPETESTGNDPPPAKQTDGKPEELQFDKKRFIWPVKGKVISRFGIQPNRMYYNGIRIAAGEGTAVLAAAPGMVIFSAPLKDYGETIIIKHDDQYATVYTHLGTRAVRGEARVRKGDRIAFLGGADEKGEAYLHFEIRHKNKARNPLFFLP
jgi:lipoprotein NlpD